MKQIKDILAENPVVSAPMAGITDRAWREIIRGMGAGLIYTEMLSDMALCYGNSKTFAMLNVAGEAPPLVVQLCGSSPEYMAEAAGIIEREAAQAGNIAAIDINMGCPAPKIVKNGEGSKLMTDLPLAERIVDAVVKAVRMPVTVKMRLGWDDEQKNVLEAARRMANAGAQAIAVHGRTRQQFYAGSADWGLIAATASELAPLKVPVIGNGDIATVEEGRRRMAESGCAGIMVGRGMLGNPWLIRDLVRAFKGEPELPPPSRQDICEMALRHLYRQAELRDEYTAVRLMRTHLPFYIKGICGAAALRGRVNKLETAAEVEAALREFFCDGGED